MLCICDSIKKEWLANCEVPELKNFHPMASSVKQRPDTAVYFKEEVGFSCDIYSSPVLWTERKATIGEADLLRLQRWKGYTDINSITTFTFPNMQSTSFLTEITVTWKDFKFLTKLTPLYLHLYICTSISAPLYWHLYICTSISAPLYRHLYIGTSISVEAASAFENKQLRQSSFI